MNLLEFETLYNNRFWFTEFKNEFKRLDDVSLNKISDELRIYERENKNQILGGLYDFAQFLYNLIYSKWGGHLNQNLVYLGTKLFVLMGMNEQARRISRGFNYDAGCCSWRLASYYRASSDLIKTIEFKNLKNSFNYFLNSSMIYEKIIMNDLIAWAIAFLPVDECLLFYEENKNYISNLFPLIILFEKLVNFNIKKATQILNDMSKFNKLTELEKILFNNKRAVIFQLKGDQRQALEHFEIASEIAWTIKDYFNLSKISFNQGSSYFLIGEYDLSLLSYQKAESLYIQLDDKIGLGKTYNALSSLYNAMGEYNIAEKYITLAKQIFSAFDNQPMNEGLIYKHAFILNIQGLYNKTIDLLKVFKPKARSILNFEALLLKVNALFEKERAFEKSEVENLLEMAKALEYKVGIGNLYLYWAKMNILQGNISEGQSNLDACYKIFQQLNFVRGTILALNLYAVIEMMKGKIESAESYCNASLLQAKNANLHSEEIESNILLANIFFINGEKDKGINLIDSILFSLSSRKTLNDFYLQAYYLRCNYDLIENSRISSMSILKKSVVEFIKMAKNSGSQYWSHHSRLLEAQEFLLLRDYLNAGSIAKEIIFSSENFETRFLARKIYIKSLIGILTQFNNQKSEIMTELQIKIELELKNMYEIISQNKLILKLIEYELLVISFNYALEDYSNVKEKFETLKELIESSGLLFYKSQ